MEPSAISSGLLTYVEGDATAPVGEGLKVIAHCCNDIGAWGAGFVVALSKRWKRPEKEYRAWHKSREGKDLPLGATQIVPVEKDIVIANIVGQHGLRSSGGQIPIRYEALSRGFYYITVFAATRPDEAVSIHMPRLGCGLAGGSWSQLEPLIEHHFIANDLPVTVYDWPGSSYNP